MRKTKQVRLDGWAIKTTKKGGYKVAGTRRATADRRFSLWEETPGTWRISRTDTLGSGKPTRTRIRIACGDLRAAIERADERLFGPHAGDSAEVAIDDGFALWMASKRAVCNRETRDDYDRRVEQFLAWARLRGIARWRQLVLSHLEQYAAELARAGLARRTIELRTNPVRCASRWMARNWPDLYRDFAAAFVLPRARRPETIADVEGEDTLSVAEVCEFLGWLSRQDPGPRRKDKASMRGLIAGVALQGLVGLRVREVLRLEWRRVDLVRGTVAIEGEVKNTSSIRLLPLCRVARQALGRAWRSTDGHGRVVRAFALDTGYSRAIAHWLRKWRPGLRMAPRGLRRTLKAEADRRGYAGRALEAYLGHSARSTADRHYASRNSEEWVELFRGQVVAGIDAASTTVEWGELWPRSSHEDKVVQLKAV